MKSKSQKPKGDETVKMRCHDIMIDEKCCVIFELWCADVVALTGSSQDLFIYFWNEI